ncbi:MAG: hypothetical protein KDH15_21665 [Rhodocyclaceae bacterium]|nr:hypothetical protein [Rhodocyclaceae bacterium]
MIGLRVEAAEVSPPGYWCVVCGRWLPADESGFIVHDAIPHPTAMQFDDDEHPQ